jgi:hypothetical protein
VVPAIRDLTIDPQGRLWVQRWSEELRPPIDVFTVDGGYLGTINLERLPMAFVGADRLAIREEMDDGTFVLQLYRLVTVARRSRADDRRKRGSTTGLAASGKPQP